jgi:hypothetical protein
MAIGAGAGAADKKLSGGSWGDALKAGAIGGATGYGAGKLSSGLSPSKGFWGRTGDVLKRSGSIFGSGEMGGGARSIMPGEHDWQKNFPEFGMNRGGGWQDLLGSILNSGGRNSQDTYGRGQEGGNNRVQAVPRQGQQGVSGFGRRMRAQLGPIMGAEDQSNPNLANSIGAGRMDAIRNQPWRGGYDINTLGDDEETITTDTMPSIYPAPRRRRQYA